MAITEPVGAALWIADPRDPNPPSNPYPAFVPLSPAEARDAIDAATTALLEELVGFFPLARRAVLAKALSPEKTKVSDIMTQNPICVGPDMLVSDAVVIMIERGFRHLPILGEGGKILGVFSVRDALPREIGNAVSLAEFNEQVNDALG